MVVEIAERTGYSMTQVVEWLIMRETVRAHSKALQAEAPPKTRSGRAKTSIFKDE